MTRQPPRTAVPRMPHPPEQLRQGLCARPGADPGLWASTQPTRRAYAITLCRACPVRAPCASYALAAPPDRLIWAGLTPLERRDLARGRQAALDHVLHPAA